MKILFIQTGGTIDKDYPRKSKGYCFEITNPAVRRIFDKVNPSFEYKILSLLRKDSLDLTDEDRETIYTNCEYNLFERIIITHGTDTMIETAKKLSTIKDKVIVLTGSLRPEKFYDSDADFNIGVAVGAINVLKKGVYIAMNGIVLPWNKVKRNPALGSFIENTDKPI